MNFDLDKSLEQLENNFWPDAASDYTLVNKCAAYRKIPLNNLSIEQLRTLVSQNIGLEFIIPVSVEKLTTDILGGGEYYPGDLLNALISIDKSYWKTNKDLLSKLTAFINNNIDHIKDAIHSRSVIKNILAFTK